MRLFFIFACLLFAVLVNGGAPVTKAVDSQIASLKIMLESEQRNDAKAELWKNLGIWLLSKDLRTHEGGGVLQPEALTAFDNALSLYYEYQLGDVLFLQANYFKGILLKAMGNGYASLACYNQIIGIAMSVEDESSVLFQKGETQFMLGHVSDAIDSFRSSLRLNNCRTDRYYSLVSAIRESGTYSISRWEVLVEEIQHVMKSCVTTSSSPVVAPEDTIERREMRSVLDLSGAMQDNKVVSENSDVYWALHIAAEKAKRYQLSWWCLETGNAMEQRRREIKFNPSDSIAQTKNIVSIFTSSFWSGLPSVAQDASRLPVFVVGMMR
jgi:tetratricopeptide (TPR) repeat protein